ncbi:hypothetical protein IFR05_014873 [Cadophora sp. M221]|nr:hypothetical protein IFR05_014873 [Cadophora sp. M221]
MNSLVREIKLQESVEIFAAAMESSTIEISKKDGPGYFLTASNSPNGQIAEFVELVQQVVSKGQSESLASHFFGSSQVDNNMWSLRRWLALRESAEEDEKVPALCKSARLYKLLSKFRSDMVLLHSKNIREAGDTRAPEWCIFTIKHTWERPSSKEQFRIIDELKTSEGLYIISHSSDKVNVSFDWRRFGGQFLTSTDPNRALTHWKQTLKQINTIHDLSRLASNHAFELSRCLKVKSGREGDTNNGGVPKRIKLDLSGVKEEMFEMVSSFCPDKVESAVG